jgi:hypothetical protein
VPVPEVWCGVSVCGQEGSSGCVREGGLGAGGQAEPVPVEDHDVSEDAAEAAAASGRVLPQLVPGVAERGCPRRG